LSAVNPDTPALAVVFSALGGFGVGGVLVSKHFLPIILAQIISYVILFSYTPRS
jgi:hypothetical protein